MAVRVTGRLGCANEAQAARVRALLGEHIRLSRAEPGCLTFDVVPTNDPLVWELNETFVDRAAYEAHQARTRASTWGIETIGLTRRFEVSEG